MPVEVNNTELHLPTFGAKHWISEQKRDATIRRLREFVQGEYNGDDDELAEPTRKEKDKRDARERDLQKVHAFPAGTGLRPTKALSTFSGFNKRFKGMKAWENKIAKDLVIDKDDILKYRYLVKKSARPGIHQEGTEILRIVVPKTMILNVLSRYHNDSVHGAHMGRDKMIDRVSGLFFWNNMTRDIARFVKSCDKCQMRKPYQPLRQGKMRFFDEEELVAEPMAVIQIDTAGPLPRTSHGMTYILVCSCHHTKMKVAIPVPDLKKHTVAMAIYRRIILPYGAPRIVVTDQGNEFTNEVMKALAEMMEIDFRHSTAYHHQTVGECENFIKWLKTALTMYIGPDHNDWDGDMLQEVVECYNKTVNKTTNLSPYFLMYGCDPREISEMAAGDNQMVEDITRVRLDRLVELAVTRENVRKQLRAEGLKRKERADLNRVEATFEVGQQVLLWSPKLSKEGLTSKFMPKWTGPWKVVQAIKNLNSTSEDAPVNYRLRADATNGRFMIRNKTEYIAHVDRLRAYTKDFLLNGNGRAQADSTIPHLKGRVSSETSGEHQPFSAQLHNTESSTSSHVSEGQIYSDGHSVFAPSEFGRSDELSNQALERERANTWSGRMRKRRMDVNFVEEVCPRAVAKEFASDLCKLKRVAAFPGASDFVEMVVGHYVDQMLAERNTQSFNMIDEGEFTKLALIPNDYYSIRNGLRALSRHEAGTTNAPLCMIGGDTPHSRVYVGLQPVLVQILRERLANFIQKQEVSTSSTQVSPMLLSIVGSSDV
jgi:hypothetical protein